MYIAQGKALVRSARIVLKARQTYTEESSEDLDISQDDLAMMLTTWLSNDREWNKYLHGKPHMPLTTQTIVTELMSRHIAWDAYLEITG
jgi:hypothetical protein